MTARRIAALLEVLGVYMCGPLLIWLLRQLFALQVTNPLDTFTAEITDTELVKASGQIFALLALQYVGYFVIAVPIGWWFRRSGPSAFGITRNGRSWGLLVLAGLATAALAEWLPLAMSLADSVYDLGDTVPWRQALFDTSWRRWQFWLFSGVLSWGLVACLEELYYRGYCQRRLAEDWGNGPAICGTAFLFAFSHGQYLRPNVYSMGMLVSLLCMAIGLGVIFAWTGSIVPSIIAHALINFPMTPAWQAAILAVLVVGAILSAKRGRVILYAVFSGSGFTPVILLALAGGSYALASGVDVVAFLSPLLLLTSVVLHARYRKRAP